MKAGGRGGGRGRGRGRSRSSVRDSGLSSASSACPSQPEVGGRSCDQGVNQSHVPLQTDEFSKIEEDIDLGGDSFGVAESDREQPDILPMDEEKVKQLEAEIESLQVDSIML